MSTTLRRVALGAAGIAASALTLAAVPATASAAGASVAAFPCGYSAQGMDAHYRHCANTFILIRADWDNGNHYTNCLGPWDETTLWHDGPHRQVNAYYVPKAPALMQNVNGQWICRAGQPDWP